MNKPAPCRSPPSFLLVGEVDHGGDVLGAHPRQPRISPPVQPTEMPYQKKKNETRKMNLRIPIESTAKMVGDNLMDSQAKYTIILKTVAVSLVPNE
jgi:hypothetical protein